MKPSGLSLLLLITGLHAGATAPTIVQPNAESVLDVASLGEAEAGEAMTNPFRVRYHPKSRVREVPLTITAVLIAPAAADASAIINGALYSPGETWEGLSVAAITADTVELRLGKIRLEVPVQDQSLTVRLPR